MGWKKWKTRKNDCCFLSCHNFIKIYCIFISFISFLVLLLHIRLWVKCIQIMWLFTPPRPAFIFSFANFFSSNTCFGNRKRVVHFILLLNGYSDDCDILTSETFVWHRCWYLLSIQIMALRVFGYLLMRGCSVHKTRWLNCCRTWFCGSRLGNTSMTESKINNANGDKNERMWKENKTNG